MLFVLTLSCESIGLFDCTVCHQTEKKNNKKKTGRKEIAQHAKRRICVSGTRHVVILHATYTLRATLCCSLLQGIAVASWYIHQDSVCAQAS